MSADTEQETDAEREQTYKRGYTHGVGKTLSAFTHKLEKDEIARIEAWVKNVLTPWEQDAAPSKSAPDFPAI